MMRLRDQGSVGRFDIDDIDVKNLVQVELPPVMIPLADIDGDNDSRMNEEDGNEVEMCNCAEGRVQTATWKQAGWSHEGFCNLCHVCL